MLAYTLLFIIFFAMYIEGNYLTAFLPVLDGSKIEWSSFTIPTIISTFIWIAIPVLVIILIKKFKFDNIKKYANYAVMIIFVMILSGLISVSFKPNLFEHRTYVITTQKNINNISKDKNFIIFVLDTVSSKTFSSELKRVNKEYVLDDFTYYPDTLGAYPFTKFAIPQILSGKVFEEKEGSFQKYYSDGIDNSEFLKALKDKDYKLNIYELEFLYNNDNMDRIENLYKGVTIHKKELLKQQIKYTLFRYLPYLVKKYSSIDTFTLDYTLTMKNEDERFYYSNKYNFDYILNKDLDVIEDKNFMFYHIEGAHLPFDSDLDLKYVKNGKYEDKVDSCITLIEMFLDRIKKSGNYDNSAIVIMADHGYDDNGYRQNPMLYIKGFNEKHKLYISDKKVSYLDLSDAFKELLENKKSDEVLKDREERYYYSYLYESCDIKENKTTSHAWEKDKLIKTGKEYKCV
jgi:hypothetical protein